MKYVVKGTTMEIKLPRTIGYKGYSVECTYKPADEEDKYWLSMWLKRSDIDDKFKIDSQEIDYINRFRYTYECFAKGNEILESERLNDKD